MKGTYILEIYLEKDSQISIGALKTVPFKNGYYYYIGSAMGEAGSSTLLNRVKRHIKDPENKKVHWHIDYLLEDENAILIRLFLIPSAQKLECIIAHEFLESSDGYIKDFGSSDCKCKSHLVYCENYNRKY